MATRRVETVTQTVSVIILYRCKDWGFARLELTPGRVGVIDAQLRDGSAISNSNKW